MYWHGCVAIPIASSARSRKCCVLILQCSFAPERLSPILISPVLLSQSVQVWSFCLLLAARHPSRFVEPNSFDPDRTDNQHLGFGGGIHYCVGAPLARLETLVALNTLVRRLVAPRLVNDPPPYRQNASLRGPQASDDCF